MRLRGYTALGMQLLIKIAGVHAFLPEHTQHNAIEPSATPIGESNEPTTARNLVEHTCPECVVQLIMPVDSNAPDREEVSHQLVNELSRLVDETASTLDRPQDEVYKGVEALVRARSSGLRSQPHFDPRTLIDPEYTEEGWRFVDRMVKLFRQFISAYVTAVADNGLSPESTSTSPASTNTAEAASMSSPTATPPSSTETTTVAAGKEQATTKISSSRKSRSRSHSSNSTSTNVENDDEDDDDEDDDDDDSDI
ncbi:hypothetical protein H4R24_001043 [Coemansia sp. RSA 988]|nr:hypothetical protein H4R24_001043 [Coemansia sp. RSA 988]